MGIKSGFPQNNLTWARYGPLPQYVDSTKLARGVFAQNDNQLMLGNVRLNQNRNFFNSDKMQEILFGIKKQQIVDKIINLLTQIKSSIETQSKSFQITNEAKVKEILQTYGLLTDKWRSYQLLDDVDKKYFIEQFIEKFNDPQIYVLFSQLVTQQDKTDTINEIINLILDDIASKKKKLKKIRNREVVVVEKAIEDIVVNLEERKKKRKKQWR